MRNKIIMATGILSAIVPCAVNNESQATDDLQIVQKTSTINRLGKAINIPEGGKLQLRDEPNDSSPLVYNIPEGAGIEVLEKAENDWYKVKYYDYMGYVYSGYVQLLHAINPDVPNFTVSKIDEKAKVLSKHSMKSLPRETSANVEELPLNAGVGIVGETDNDWYKIKYYDKVGYSKVENISILRNNNSSADTNLNIVDMNKFGKVIGVKSDDTLNVRELPDSKSSVLYTLKNSTEVRIIGQDKESGWYKINYNGKIGFASNRYIDIVKPTVTSYKVTGDIKIRKSKSWSAEYVAVAKKGTFLDVISLDKDWAEVYYDNNIYYAPSEYLVNSSEDNTTTPPVEPEVPPVKPPVEDDSSGGKYKATDAINLRETKSWTGNKIAVINKGDEVEVISWESEWSKVRYNSYVGYAPSSYLVKIEDSKPNPPVEEEKPVEKTQIATVNVDDLNIRAGAGTSYSILAKVNKGDTVLVKEKSSNGWYKVELVTGTVGWCNGVYLENFREGSLPVVPPSGGGSESKPEDTNQTVKGKIATVNTNDLNIRSGADTIYPILAKVNKGDIVLIKDSNSSGWYKVQLTNGVIGWCNGRYLENFREGSITVNPTPPSEGNLDAMINKVISVARAQIGKPYKYGSAGPDSFDCSGLSYYAFKNGANITLPRVSREQATVGKFVSKSDLRPGDLVFFNTSGSGISHLGIYIGNDEMIHAPSSGKSVEIAKITLKYWTNSYVTARRVIY